MYFGKGTKQKEREEKNLRSKVISELTFYLLDAYFIRQHSNVGRIPFRCKM